MSFLLSRAPWDFIPPWVTDQASYKRYYEELQKDFDPPRVRNTLMTTHKIAFHEQYLERVHVPQKIYTRIEKVGLADWDVILQTDFIQAILDIMLDKCFCGFTKAELTSLAKNADKLTLHKQVRVHLAESPLERAR